MTVTLRHIPWCWPVSQQIKPMPNNSTIRDYHYDKSIRVYIVNLSWKRIEPVSLAKMTQAIKRRRKLSEYHYSDNLCTFRLHYAYSYSYLKSKHYDTKIQKPCPKHEQATPDFSGMAQNEKKHPHLRYITFHNVTYQSI